VIGGIRETAVRRLRWFSWAPLAKGGLRHGFTARTGGASRGAFASLNFTSRQGDNPSRVRENWRRLEEAADLNGRWGLVRQVHGSAIARRLRGRPASDRRDGCAAADAVATKSSTLTLGILTADCLPLILGIAGQGHFSVVHAGWKGTLQGIAGKAAKTLAAEAGADVKDVLALLGPSIGPCCYEVGHEVYRSFREAWGGPMKGVFTRADPWRLDLKGANRRQLLEAGLVEDHIGVVDLCTSCRKDLFFSHRRDGTRTGRMLAFATAAPVSRGPA